MTNLRMPDECWAKCGNRVRDVLRYGPADSGMSKVPVQLGPFYDDAYKVRVVLMNGHRMDFILCEECAAAISPSRLLRIWRDELRLWRESAKDDWRALRRIRAMNAKAAGLQRTWLKSQIFNVPLGVLGKRQFKVIRGSR